MRNNNGAYFLIGLIGVLAFIIWLSTNNTTEPIDFKKALTDSMKTWRGKDSLHNAQIMTLEADRELLLSVVDEKDKDIVELLNNPKIKEVIKIKVVTKFDTTILADSIGEDCRGNWSFDNNWVSADISVHRDTMFVKHLTVRNELTISHKEEKESTVIHIKQQNPYSQTTYAKDYIIARQQPKKNNWLKNLLIGIGVGVTVGFLAH